MALLVVRAKEKDGIDFDKYPKANRLSRKYDIIDVLDDGANPGNCVCLPEYLVVQVEGQTRMDMLPFSLPEMSSILDPDTKKPAMLQKRKFRFNFDSKMSAKDLNDIKKSTEWLIKKVSGSDIEEKS